MPNAIILCKRSIGRFLLVISLVAVSVLQWPFSLEHAAAAPIDPTISLRETDNYFQPQEDKFHWNDQNHFVLINIATATYLPDWQESNVQTVRDAFAEWQHALNNRLLFVFVNDPSQADVIVTWWHQTDPRVSNEACGQTRLQYWGHFLASDDIYLSLHDQQGSPWPPSTLYSIALHEIGHMIGIAAHSPNLNDIMYVYEGNMPRHLSQRDINTAHMLYSLKASITNPPGYHLSQFEAFRKTQSGKRIWIPLML